VTTQADTSFNRYYPRAYQPQRVVDPGRYADYVLSYVASVERLTAEDRESPPVTRFTATDPLRLSRDREVLDEVVQPWYVDGVISLIAQISRKDRADSLLDTERPESP
jgi:hypothetical protein